MPVFNPTNIVGTADQVLANGSVGTNEFGIITLTLPQSIGSTSTPTFSTLTLSGLTPNSFLHPTTDGLITSTSAATDGQILIGSTGNLPVKASLTPGTGISVTPGAGSITLSNTGVLSFSGGTTGLTPNTATSGAVTLAGTLNAVNGGTGLATYAVGDILFANTTTTLARRADVATGNALISGGVGVAPLYGKIGLTTHISGVLPIANGGTNLSTTPTNGQLLIGNGTGYTLASLTAGSGVTITPGAGTITISSPSTGGTVTSVAAAQPASGLTITGSPITTSGTLTFALANDLLAVENLATTGIATRTAADTWTTRIITGTTNTITVTNGSGVAGNPTITIADNPIIPGTADIQIPAGTTAQRPGTPVNGMIRYNTTLNRYEAWVVDRWLGFSLFGNNYTVNYYRGTIPIASGTTVVDYDNTTPLVTEGSQVWTTTITPVSTTSLFEIDLACTVDLSSNNRVIIASLFRGTVNIGSAMFFSTGGARPNTLTMSVSDSPGVTTATTYSWRVGVGNGAATWYINSTSAGADLGGSLVSEWNIKEIA